MNINLQRFSRSWAEATPVQNVFYKMQAERLFQLATNHQHRPGGLEAPEVNEMASLALAVLGVLQVETQARATAARKAAERIKMAESHMREQDDAHMQEIAKLIAVIRNNGNLYQAMNYGGTTCGMLEGGE